MPFKVFKNQYAIIFDFSRIKTKNKTTAQLIDEYLTKLQQQYPLIELMQIRKHQKGINLQKLVFEERNKVLQQLARDSAVAFICNLYAVGRAQQIAYCNNRVYADIDIEEAEDFKAKAHKLGFMDIEITEGGNRYWLTFPGKLIDESFFESFDRLTREKLVFSVYFNQYMDPEPELEKLKYD
jgi:hypothetical protein